MTWPIVTPSVWIGDNLSSLQKAVEQKETSRQQLREQLDAVERETRAKLLEIDAFNTQLKVGPIVKHVRKGQEERKLWIWSNKSQNIIAQYV